MNVMRPTVVASLLAIFFAVQAKCAPPESEAPAADSTIEQFLQSLSTVPNVVERRDPFIAVTAPFTAAVAAVPQVQADAVSYSAPVLERYPVSQYGVVAVLLGDRYPRALLRLPGSEGGKVVIVKQKDKLGNKGGVINKITRDGLTILEMQRSPLGFVDKTEVSLTVGSKGLGGPPPPPPPAVPGQPAPGPDGAVPAPPGALPTGNQWSN